MELQPSVTTPATIPPEIWMHVAKFIPHSDLCSMFTINQAFFQLSMDARYRKLYFGTGSDPEGLWRIQRARDPSISHRVRRLCVSLKLREKFIHQFNEEGDLNPGWTSISLLEWIHIMTKTATCLTNITEFSLRWEEFPHENHVTPLITAACNTFGPKLRKLSFRGSLDYLATLVSTADGLIALQDLNLIVNRVVGETDEVLATILAPFVNKVAPTLHSLSYSSDSFDPSPFFRHLETIPNLEQLCISVDGSGASVTEPLEATRFLYNHATTLRHLDWNWRHRSHGQYFLDSLSEKDLQGTFSNVCTWPLGIRIPGSPNGFAMVVQHIKCSSRSLTSLGLFCYDMANQGVATVIAIFTPHSVTNLKELSLWVELFSPELIQFLSRQFPQLKKLTINSKRLIGVRAANREAMFANGADISQELREERLQFQIFTDKMSTYDFRGWALSDIDIMMIARDEYLYSKLMALLVQSIPSLQIICGNARTGIQVSQC